MGKEGSDLFLIMEDMIKYFSHLKKWNSEQVPDDEWPSNEVREKPFKGFKPGNDVMRFAF